MQGHDQRRLLVQPVRGIKGSQSDLHRVQANGLDMLTAP
jgi:hypothetical protein